MYDVDSNLSRSDIGSPFKPRQNPHGSTASLLVGEEASVVMRRKFSGSDSKLTSTTSNTDKKSVTLTPPSDASAQWTAAVQWIMNNEPLHFAVELTRIQWELFLSIRVSLPRPSTCIELTGQPRDVFRHDMGKEPNTPVGQSIAFFNRVSRW